MQSPNYPDEYPPNKDCTWIIQAPAGHQIRLKANKFVLENHDNCHFDYVEVRNGASNSSTLLGKFCGTNFPSNIRSFSNTLYLRFNSDFSASEAGFEIEWESTASGCGGVLTSHEGTVSSPNYPMPYHNRAFCTYRITTSQGSSLLITFDDLNLEARTICFDSIEVFEGTSMKSLTGGAICEKATPFNITTEGNSAVIVFKTDFSDSGRGFNLNYKTQCTKKLSGYSGVIESPNFPDKYPHHADCEWTIDVPLGNKLHIEFSRFELEVPLFTSSCDFDYLEIVEMGLDQREISRKRHCRQRPETMEIAAASVKIAFHTDVSQSEAGFRLEWKIQGCGDIFVRPQGRIAENNYNRSLPVECNWQVAVGIGSHVELTISELNFDGGRKCSSVEEGGLMIANDQNFTYPQVVQCDRLATGTVLRSSGHQMFIRLVMKRSSPASFVATFREERMNCGGRVTNKGSISSSNYPKNYEAGQDCEWLLEVPADHTMTIRIVDMDLYESQNCAESELKVMLKVT